MYNSIKILLLIVFTLSAQNKKSAINEAMDELEKAKSMWEKMQNKNIEYEIQWRNSIYHPCQSGPIIVKLKNNRLDTAFYRDTVWQHECKENFATPFLVDSIFDWLKEGILMPAAHYGAEYDTITGIPLNGYIDFEENVVDDEISFSIKVLGKSDNKQ
jgi:hypothetical protein